MSKRIALFAGVLILGGCAAQIQQPVRRCEGKKTAAEAIETLNSHRDKAMPIRAAGQCLLRYHLEGKQHKENFPVKLWINPPDGIYLQGDVAFNATGLVLGSNADEFWFWLKPKEISSYWWGRWSQAGTWNSLVLSPTALLEAFGSVNLHDGRSSLTRIDGLDVLVLHNEQGTVLKRVYIEPCNYVVSKIEYLDSAGRFGRAEFADYQQIDDGFSVPTSINIIAFSSDGNNDSVRISLNTVKPTEISQQQQQRLFVRPQPRGFEHVYEIIDGAAVEQKTE
ncbi:MAG: hypothetical protein ABII09_06650 [Planctomycetota bacterium]